MIQRKPKGVPDDTNALSSNAVGLNGASNTMSSTSMNNNNNNDSSMMSSPNDHPDTAGSDRAGNSNSGASNGNGAKRKSGGNDTPGDVEARANRVAMNLAKLDSANSLLPRTPLQWKGYAWRTFDQVRGALTSRPPRVSSKSHALAEDGMANGSRDDLEGGGNNGATKPNIASSQSSLVSGLLSTVADVTSSSSSSSAAGSSSSPSLLGGESSSCMARCKTHMAGFKQWAITGIRRRSCKVISCLIVLAAIVGVCAVLTFSAWFGWFFAQDPCVVSKQRLNFLAMHPRVSRAQPDFVPVLPKIIHQQWKTRDVPEGNYAKWHKNFLQVFPEPEFTHMMWTDENARELIKSDYPYFLEAYDAYEFGIQRADAVRYFVLHKYGGLYADLDYEPLVNFWEHVPKDRVALVESPYQYNEKAQNSLMSSPIGDPFWLDTFRLLQERKDKPVLQATGPMFLDALMKRATEVFYLFPCENFQRLPLHLSKEEEASPFMSQLHRELLGRLAPMKYCGDYHQEESCQYGKHHNTASYLADTGVLKLLWT